MIPFSLSGCSASIKAGKSWLCLMLMKNASKCSGFGMSQIVIFVTIPKLDWVKSPSTYGPIPHL